VLLVAASACAQTSVDVFVKMLEERGTIVENSVEGIQERQDELIAILEKHPEMCQVPEDLDKKKWPNLMALAADVEMDAVICYLYLTGMTYKYRYDGENTAILYMLLDQCDLKNMARTLTEKNDKRLKLLLSKYPLTRYSVYKNGETLLHVACNQKLRTLKIILDDPIININKRDKNGCTPLALACLNRNKQMIQCLLEAGANPDIGERGYTPRAMIAKDPKIQSCQRYLDKFN